MPINKSRAKLMAKHDARVEAASVGFPISISTDELMSMMRTSIYQAYLVRTSAISAADV